MTNSVCTTVVEVTNNIHDTVVMASCQSQPHNNLTSLYVKVVILNNVIFAFKMSLLSESISVTQVTNPKPNSNSI